MNNRSAVSRWLNPVLLVVGVALAGLGLWRLSVGFSGPPVQYFWLESTLQDMRDQDLLKTPEQIRQLATDIEQLNARVESEKETLDPETLQSLTNELKNKKQIYEGENIKIARETESARNKEMRIGGYGFMTGLGLVVWAVARWVRSARSRAA